MTLFPHELRSQLRLYWRSRELAFFTFLLPIIMFVLLGAAAFTALGVALTVLIRSAEGSSAVVNAIYLPLSFVSGAFFSPHHFPSFLRSIADVLPLSFVIRLVRDTVLKDVQIWDRPGWVAVVAAWGLAGTVVALHRFRWEPSEG